MTNTARTSSTRSPAWLDWNAWAVPEKLVVMLDGSVCRAMRCTWATAVPMETPCRRSNEIVTDGSCPAWFTVSGPTLEPRVASDASGTSVPFWERMYSRLSAERSCWYWGRSSMTTQYWLVAVYIVET